MADSDGDYMADDLSDDDIDAHLIDGNGHSTRSSGLLRAPIGSKIRGGDREGGNNRRKAAWEDIQRSWDTVVEGADGSINSTVEGLKEAGKRQRCVRERELFNAPFTNCIRLADYFETRRLCNAVLFDTSSSSSTYLSQ